MGYGLELVGICLSAIIIAARYLNMDPSITW